MDAARIERATARDEWKAGWILLVPATISFALSSMPLAAVGVLVKPLGQQFGWSRGAMSLAILLTAIGTLTLAPVIGPLIDRIGPRRVALRGMVMVGLATMSIGLAGPSILSWYLGWALYAIAQTCSNGLVWSTAVVSRFDVNRGTALATFLTVQALAFGVTPIASLWILGAFGWRWIFFSIGLGSLLIGWPLTWWLFYGAHDVERSAAALNSATSRGGLTKLRAATATRQFWQIAVAFSIAAASIGAIFIHLQPILIDAGITPRGAAVAVLLIGPSSVGGRLLSGMLLDRFPPQWIAAMALFFPALAYAMLLFLAKSEAAGLVIAMCIGLTSGAETDLLTYVVSRYFRPTSFSSIYSLLLGVYGVGYGIAPVAAGAAFDATGSYVPVFLTLMIAALFGALLLIMLGRPNAEPAA